MVNSEAECIVRFDRISKRFYEQYLRNVSFADRLRLFVTAVCANVSPPAMILDFGCGPGVIALSLAQLGYIVSGLDGAANMIEIARRTQREIGVENATFDVVSASEWNGCRSVFDAVVCSSVLEYIGHDVELIQSLVTALKPGGMLALSVPQRLSMGSFLEVAGHLKRSVLQRSKDRRLNVYGRRYSRRHITSRLSKLGMRNIECTTFEFPVLGDLGVKLSRRKWIGTMAMFVAQKGLACDIGGATSLSSEITMCG